MLKRVLIEELIERRSAFAQRAGDTVGEPSDVRTGFVEPHW